MRCYKSDISKALKVLTFCLILSKIDLLLADPPTGDGRPPIDWTCTTSAVRSADPVKCVTEKAIATIREDPILFEGDIAGVIKPGDTIADLGSVLSMQTGTKRKLQNLSRAGALMRPRWWGGNVYYEIASNFTDAERVVIVQAFKEFERTDVVRFHQRSTEPNYLNIFRGSGCWSYVGMLGGLQPLSLGPGCVHHGVIVHELNHALGFFHEQSRTDRDGYVELNFNNVPQDQQHNFNKYSSSEVTTSGTGYDFDSIMHYGMYAFAIDDRVWTIRPKSPYQNHNIGQIQKLSDTDILEINALYPLCATLWFDPNFANGEARFVAGVEANLNATSQDQFSSTTVTFGCTLTTYNLVNFQGETTILKPMRKRSVWHSFKGRSYDNSIRSLKCTCA